MFYESRLTQRAACTRLVGLPLRGVRVFRQVLWLEVGSGKTALSRPAQQRVTHTVGLLQLQEVLL